MFDVSVVIPCYNAEAYIDECVGSITRQEGVAVEIIAVEDRSSDGTWDRLQDLAATIPSLKLHRMERNAGQATARNRGMEHATGRYVAFLDSDDSYRSTDVLARWVAAADRDTLDLGIANYSTLFEDGTIRANQPVPPIPLPGGVGSAKDSPGIANTAQSWQVLFRRAFLAKTALAFSERLRQREDRLFFIEAFTRAERIGVISMDAILYRVHANSTMRRVDFDQLAQFNIHMELMAGFMDEAREAGRICPDFERANAVAYWRQTLEYWRPLLLRALNRDATAQGQALDETEREATFGFLARIQALTGHCGPLWKDRYIQRSGYADDLRAEAAMDIARMAVAANRLDVLATMLEPRRVHHSVLRPLVAEAGYDWGEAAVARYLCFNRAAVFDEENAATAPPLASLVKRVVLHIGTTKTGSSAMQEFCELNRFRLLDRGVWYPMSGAWRENGVRRERSAGHLYLLRELVSGEDAAERVRHLAAEIAALGQPVDTLVLSAENVLSHAIWPDAETAFSETGDPVRRIVAALGLEQVEVAVVFRRQDAWFKSFYREVTANPFNSFTAAPLTFFDTLFRRSLFDYERLIAWFEASPVVGRMHVESFGRIRAAGGSIPWFLGVLGIDPEKLVSAKDTQVSNESFSDAVAANVRLLKLLHLDRPQAELLFKKVMASSELSGSQFSLFSHDDWAAIEARLAPHVAAFDARFPGEARPQRLPVEADESALPVLPALARTEPKRLWLGLKPDGEETPLDRPLGEVLDTYAYVLASRSWRLTAPLRWAITAAKALRNRIREAGK